MSQDKKEGRLRPIVELDFNVDVFMPLGFVDHLAGVWCRESIGRPHGAGRVWENPLGFVYSLLQDLGGSKVLHNSPRVRRSVTPWKGDVSDATWKNCTASGGLHLLTQNRTRPLEALFMMLYTSRRFSSLFASYRHAETVVCTKGSCFYRVQAYRVFGCVLKHPV